MAMQFESNPLDPRERTENPETQNLGTQTEAGETALDDATETELEDETTDLSDVEDEDE